MTGELAPTAAAHAAAAGERALPAGWTPAALLFFSGAIALVYETLWLRSFSASFGATAPTAAATISAVLCGLALGSAWFGARAASWQRPLRAYALLELGAALLALVVPLAQPLWSRATTLALEGLGDSAALAVRVLAVFVALLPPTFLLGGTLPVLARLVDDRTDATGARCGWLYAANTAGAVLGVLAVPFALLPALGAGLSYRLAIAGSVALAIAAAVVDRVGHATSAAPAAKTSAVSGERSRRLLALAAASGFLVLGLEVVWMRMLAQVHPNSLQAFALVLGTFLAALAIGASLGTAAARRTRDPWRLLRRIWSVAGLLVLATPACFVFATRGLAELADGSRGEYVLDLVRVCALAFAPAAVCAGMALPVLIALSTSCGGAASKEVGSLLAWNTAGSVLGPLAATFALFQWLGTWGTTAALGLGLVALPYLAGRRARAFAAVPLLGFALAGHALTLPRVHVDSTRGEQLVWLREGAHGIVSALRDGPTLRLALDNSYVLGGTGSRGDARVLGHLPLLLHGAPRSVAFLGLGTGITASAALEHGVDEVTVFELVPEVAEAARTVFAPENERVLDDPRVRLIADDARSHLASTDERYDVVVGDLVVPWRRGESSLFTREHFAGVRRALGHNGLFCQWLPLYQMTDEELRIVAATFLDVFPEASVWRGDFVAYLPVLGLVGRADGAALAPSTIGEIDRRTAALAETLALDSRYLAHPAGLWLHYAGELRADEPWVRAERRNTQDLPWLELLGARAQPSDAESDSCVGEPLLRFLHGLTTSPALDAEHERWRALGHELFEASSLASAGDDERARTMAFDVLERLPAEIRASVLGPTAPAAPTANGEAVR